MGIRAGGAGGRGSPESIGRWPGLVEAPRQRGSGRGEGSPESIGRWPGLVEAPRQRGSSTQPPLNPPRPHGVTPGHLLPQSSHTTPRPHGDTNGLCSSLRLILYSTTPRKLCGRALVASRQKLCGRALVTSRRKLCGMALVTSPPNVHSAPTDRPTASRLKF